MNYRVRKQIRDQAQHYGTEVLERGEVIEDPPWRNLRQMIGAGYLVPVDESGLVTADEAALVSEAFAPAPHQEEVAAAPALDIQSPSGEASASPPIDGDTCDSEAGAPPQETGEGSWSCRFDACTAGPWDTKRARTSHEVRAHGRPGREA